MEPAFLQMTCRYYLIPSMVLRAFLSGSLGYYHLHFFQSLFNVDSHALLEVSKAVQIQGRFFCSHTVNGTPKTFHQDSLQHHTTSLNPYTLSVESSTKYR